MGYLSRAPTTPASLGSRRGTRGPISLCPSALTGACSKARVRSTCCLSCRLRRARRVHWSRSALPTDDRTCSISRARSPRPPRAAAHWPDTTWTRNSRYATSGPRQPSTAYQPPAWQSRAGDASAPEIPPRTRWRDAGFQAWSSVAARHLHQPSPSLHHPSSSRFLP